MNYSFLNLVTAIVVSVLIIFGWQHFYEKPKLQRLAEEQKHYNKTLENVKKGDLVFFAARNRKKVIDHVGLVTEIKGDEIIFIHSTTQRGVILSSTKEPYYQRTFAQANRVLSEDYF